MQINDDDDNNNNKLSTIRIYAVYIFFKIPNSCVTESESIFVHVTTSSIRCKEESGLALTLSYGKTLCSTDGTSGQ